MTNATDLASVQSNGGFARSTLPGLSILPDLRINTTVGWALPTAQYPTGLTALKWCFRNELLCLIWWALPTLLLLICPIWWALPTLLIWCVSRIRDR